MPKNVSTISKRNSVARAWSRVKACRMVATLSRPLSLSLLMPKRLRRMKEGSLNSRPWKKLSSSMMASVLASVG